MELKSLLCWFQFIECLLWHKSFFVRVSRRDAARDVKELGYGLHCIQDSGVLEKQWIFTDDKPLAIKHFGEDSGHKRKNDEDLCVHDHNAILPGSPSSTKKKRKHSEEIQGSKYFLHMPVNFSILLTAAGGAIFFSKLYIICSLPLLKC